MANGTLGAGRRASRMSSGERGEVLEIGGEPFVKPLDIGTAIRSSPERFAWFRRRGPA